MSARIKAAQPASATIAAVFGRLTVAPTVPPNVQLLLAEDGTELTTEDGTLLTTEG